MTKAASGISRRPAHRPFVMPGTVRYELWDGDAGETGVEWIELKRQITYGDEQDMAGKIVKSIKIPEGADDEQKKQLKAEVEVMLDVAIDGPFKILVWTVDWNLADDNGKSVDLEFESVRQLSLDYADEINRIIKEHEEATGQGKARKKKSTG